MPELRVECIGQTRAKEHFYSRAILDLGQLCFCCFLAGFCHYPFEFFNVSSFSSLSYYYRCCFVSIDSSCPDYPPPARVAAAEEAMKKALRMEVVDFGNRPDGRRADETRPLTAEVC